jgi:O-antigen ligase
MGVPLYQLRRHAPVLLLGVLLLAPLMAWPDAGRWLGMRAFVMQCVAFALLALLLGRLTWSPHRVKRFLLTGPNLPILLLVAWAALSFLLTAPASGRAHNIALAELLRLGCGAIVYFAAAYLCCTRERLRQLVLILLVGGALASVAGIASYTWSEPHTATAAFGNSQLLAAYLVVLLPVAVVFSQVGEMDGRRLLACVAAVLIASALLLTGDRSAWIGAAAALLLVAALGLRAGHLREVARHKHLWLVPGILALGAVGLFFALGRSEPPVSARAATLAAPTAPPSFQWRLQLWSICERIVRTHPLAGAGVGSYPLVANDAAVRIGPPTLLGSSAPALAITVGGHAYSGIVPTAEQVRQQGDSMSSMAHNEYLQIAAELGLIGLALYLALLVRFVRRGFMAISRTGSRSRRAVFIAAMGAVVAGCVSAAGNPAWRFPDVAPLLWLALGVGVAATRARAEGADADPGEPGTIVGRPAGAVVWAAMRVASLLAASAFALPAYANGPGWQPGGPTQGYLGITPADGVTLDFGTVWVGGQPTYQDITITNLNPCSSTLTGSVTPSGDFRIVGNTNINLNSGASQGYRICFMPDRPRLNQWMGDFTVNTNDPRPNNVGHAVVHLKGCGASFEHPDRIDFGFVPVGGQAQRPVTIRKTSWANITVDLHVINGLAQAFSVNPSGHASLDVTATVIFQPTAQHFDPHPGGALQITVISPPGAPQPVHHVLLEGRSGNANQPSLGPLPGNVTFNPTPVGQSSVIGLDIKNVGQSGDLKGSVIVVGYKEFSGGGQFALMPGQTKTFPITFKPDRAGTLRGEAVIKTNDTTHRLAIVPLVGVAPPPPPRIRVKPTSIDFGTFVQSGSIYTQRSVFVQSVGGAGSILQGSVSVSGPPFFLTSSRSFVLPGGQTAAAVVAFRPGGAALGRFNGTVTITSNSPTEPTVVVNLTANVVPPKR